MANSRAMTLLLIEEQDIPIYTDTQLKQESTMHQNEVEHVQNVKLDQPKS